LSNDTRKCEHIKTNGVRCGSPALREEKFCYFHDRARRDFPHRAEAVQVAPGSSPAGPSSGGTALDIPFPEDADAIQYGLGKVIYGLLNGLIDHRTAGLALYALQTASGNLKNTSMFKRAQEADEREATEPSPLLKYYLDGIRNTRPPETAVPEHPSTDARVQNAPDAPPASPNTTEQSLVIHAQEEQPFTRVPHPSHAKGGVVGSHPMTPVARMARFFTSRSTQTRSSRAQSRSAPQPLPPETMSPVGRESSAQPCHPH
jgi:hypothetical protein